MQEVCIFLEGWGYHVKFLSVPVQRRTWTLHSSQCYIISFWLNLAYEGFAIMVQGLGSVSLPHSFLKFLFKKLHTVLFFIMIGRETQRCFNSPSCPSVPSSILQMRVSEYCCPHIFLHSFKLLQACCKVLATHLFQPNCSFIHSTPLIVNSVYASLQQLYTFSSIPIPAAATYEWTPSTLSTT